MTSGPSGTNPNTQGGADVTSDVAERLRFEALTSQPVDTGTSHVGFRCPEILVPEGE